MTTPPSGDPGPTNSRPQDDRPRKTGQPWPKRFTFTPDGDMSFIKHDKDIRGGRGPRRADDRPRRFDDRQRPAGAGPTGPRPTPRPYGANRPNAPRTDGSAPYSSAYQKSFRPPAPRPGGPARADYSRPAEGGPRPFQKPFRPGGAERPARPGWEPRTPDRPYNRPERPQFSTSYRKPEPGSVGRPVERPGDRPKRDFSSPRPPARSGPSARPAYGKPPGKPYGRPFEKPSDRSFSPPRSPRGPVVIDRTSGSSRPWQGDEEPKRPVRPLPRPQSGRETRPPRAYREEDDAPASRQQLAERIIAKSTPKIPADLLLRQTLARRKQLNRADAAWISRAVFSHFRWQGWLDVNQTPAEQLDRAISLADDFAISPGKIADDELLARAIPPWTLEALDVTPAWVRSLQAEPMLWLRARTGMAAEVAARLENCETPSQPAFAHALRYDGLEDLFRHELFQSGAFEIQDLASQAVSLVCAPQPGEMWWDACAGEGGKTLHLADLMDGKGLVWASDRAEWRLARLKQRAGRAGCFNYRSVPWTGGAKRPTQTQFDGVLLDAPCSGVGTWGRNPHARWTTSVNDVSELSVLQGELLSHAAPAVKPGGKLVYSVCTLTRAETTQVAEAFTAAHPEFEPLPVTNPFAPESPAVTPLCLWPQDTHGNGMFIAAWRRRAD